MTAITNLEKLQKLINNFPPRASDAGYQKELFDEIFNALSGLNRSKASAVAVAGLRKEVEALKDAK